MRPDPQAGFAIVSAIFILVVLAALGGFIATISTTQHVSLGLDVTGARAYQAARAGTEWGLARALKSSSCVASSNIGQIEGISVTVTCTTAVSGNTVEAGLGTIHHITATACSIPTGAGACPGNPALSNYVERRITVMVEK